MSGLPGGSWCIELRARTECSRNLRRDAAAARVDAATSIDSKEPIRVDDDPVTKRPRGGREAAQRRVGMGQ